MRSLWHWAWLTAVLAVGCEVPELETPQVAATAQTSQEPQKSYIDAASDVPQEWYLPDGRIDMSDVPGEPPMTSGIPRAVHPKDPKQGKLSRKSRSGLGTTMQAMPWVKNETTFNIVIKQALAQFEAINSRYPTSHQEFMERFIPEFCPQVLPLPELEPGDEYIYDPEDHLLKIWRPAEATPEIRAKYLGEETTAETPSDNDRTEFNDSAGSQDPSIRGRANALQGQVDSAGQTTSQQ